MLTIKNNNANGDLLLALRRAHRIYEQFRRERSRMIADSDARLLQVRRQAEEEQDSEENQMRLREIEIPLLQRDVQQAYSNHHISKNAALVATEELVRGHAQNIGAVLRLATPPGPLGRSPRPVQNAAPSRQANLRPARNPHATVQGKMDGRAHE